MFTKIQTHTRTSHQQRKQTTKVIQEANTSLWQKLTKINTVVKHEAEHICEVISFIQTTLIFVLQTKLYF